MPLRNRLMVIWTMGNRPFVMGGAVHYPMGTKAKCVGPYNVGRGYNVFVANGPGEKCAVVEARSGAVVGSDLEKVRRDVKTGDPKLMKQQVARALEEVKKVELIEESEWWRRRNGTHSASQTSSSGQTGLKPASGHS